MRTIRLSILVIGILFPFLMMLIADGLRIAIPDFARTLIITADPAWQRIIMTTRETHTLLNIGLGGFLLVAIPCGVAAAAMVRATFTYHHRCLILFPTLSGFGFLAHAYLMNSFNPDPQGALVYIFGPIYSLGFIFIGWLIGLGVDRLVLKKNK